jgi:hypothetical protein
VTVDGQAAQIAPYLNILRSVELGEGKHQVIFTFQPISVYAGWGIALIGWLSILLISLKQGRQKEYGIA